MGDGDLSRRRVCLRKQAIPACTIPVLILLSACGGGDSSSGSPTAPRESPRATAITLSASSLSMDALGATAQLTATVKDQFGATMGAAAVTWSSSSASVATVSGSGLVTAARNGSATITATSATASAQAMVTVRQEAATAEITPDSAELIVNQVVFLEVDFKDRNGNELEGITVTPTWSSSVPSVATVSESGTVRGVAAGTTQIQATAGAVVATATMSVAEASTPEVETRSVTGTVEIPASVDSAAVWVYSGVSGAATVASDGSFASETAVNQEGTLIAMNGDRLLGLSIQPPEGSAAPASAVRAAATTTGVMIDARTTAVALVFLTPLFAVAPPGVTQEILDLIDGLAEIDALEAAIRASVENTGGMPDENDAAFVSAYKAVVQAAHEAMAARAGVSPQELIQALLVPDQKLSGVELDFPDGDAQASMTVMVRNVYGRDVDVYLSEADDEGNPRKDLANLGSYKEDRVLQLPPADYVLDITSIGEWINFFRGVYGADDPTPLLLTFTPAKPRYLLYAYGLGVSGLGSDLASINGSENWRWAVPSAFTATFSFVLPIIEATGGFRFIPKLRLGGGYTDLRFLVETMVDAAEILRCVGNDSDQAMVIICLGNEMQSFFINHPDELASLIQSAAATAGQNLTINTINGVLRNVIPVVKLVSLASTLGDLFVTSYAIAASELRQEFDLSYNRLLGAESIEKVNGDNQVVSGGEQLARELVVRVTDPSGGPVENAWVEWTPNPANGTLSHALDTTSADGLASVGWSLGPDTATQHVTASLAGTGAAVEFMATRVPPIFAASGSISLTGAGVPPSDLYVVGISPQSTDSLVGRIRTTSGSEPVITDVARAPEGSLWGVSFTLLYRLDTLTAVATEVGDLSVSDVNALTFDADGGLFGATVSGVFLQIDTVTGQAREVGSFGSGLTSSGDLAFAPDGTLFAAMQTAAGVVTLAVVDPATGRAIAVDAGTSLGFGNVFGLSFARDQLFGLTTDIASGAGKLIVIDTEKGTGAYVRDLSFQAFGAGTSYLRPQ